MAAMVEIAIVVDYFDDNNGVCVESVDSKAVEHDRRDVCVGDVDTQLISPAETQDESDFLPQESLICCHCVRGGCTVLVAKKTSEPHQRETGFRSVGQTTLHIFH